CHRCQNSTSPRPLAFHSSITALNCTFSICMAVNLTEALLSKAAGWEAMKRARAYIEQGQVLSSSWNPPLLRGVVQASETSFRASLVLKNDIDIENLCTCRESREWGKICAHSVAVGLHWLKSQSAPNTSDGEIRAAGN